MLFVLIVVCSSTRLCAKIVFCFLDLKPCLLKNRRTIFTFYVYSSYLMFGMAIFRAKYASSNSRFDCMPYQSSFNFEIFFTTFAYRRIKPWHPSYYRKMQSKTDLFLIIVSMTGFEPAFHVSGYNPNVVPDQVRRHAVTANVTYDLKRT